MLYFVYVTIYVVLITTVVIILVWNEGSICRRNLFAHPGRNLLKLCTNLYITAQVMCTVYMKDKFSQYRA